MNYEIIDGAKVFARDGAKLTRAQKIRAREILNKLKTIIHAEGTEAATKSEKITK